MAHWYLKEELKWRSIASAVWTWNTAFPILTVFLLGFTLDVSKHIFTFYDFVGSLLSVHTLVTCFAIASLTVLLIRLHLGHYAVAPTFPRNRFELMQRLASPNKLFFTFVISLYSMLVAHFATSLISGRYSWDYQCVSSEVDTDLPSRSCQSGFHQMFIMFGLVIGLTIALDRLLNQKYCLSFQNVQEAKFLSIKCRFPRIIYESAVKGIKLVYYFLAFYLVFGFLLRDVIIVFSGTQARVLYSLQVWKIFQVFPVMWNMWLVATLILLLVEVSWQYFSIYQTREYNFLLDPVLPENQYKLLVENMEGSNPPIVQYLACRQLSLIAKHKVANRKQIFALNRSTENGQPVSWNRIMANCLDCIKQLTNDVSEYQRALSEVRRQHESAHSDGEVVALDRSGQNHINVTSPRHRQRFTLPVHQNSATSFTDHSLPNLNVPTPRLWTTFSESDPNGKSPCSLENETTQIELYRKRTRDFAGKLSIFNYFFRMIPSWSLRNVYRRHLAVIWAMQSISYLCAASVVEDRFGVVQGRLRDIITCLSDLLLALENLSKVAISSNYVDKIHISLCSEVKSSLHRIVETYGDSLKSVNIPQEYKTKLLAFQAYDS